MGNTTVTIEVTPQEALIIENIRALQAQTTTVFKSDDQYKQDLVERYMNMDDDAFMTHFRDCMGDEIVVEGVQETHSVEDLLTAIVPFVDADVVDDLFNRYTPEDTQNEMFLNYHGKEELVVRLVDMIMDGSWTPEND